MICTTHEEVGSRTVCDACRHAIRYDDAVGDHRSAGDASATGIRQPRVNYIDATDVSDGDGILICQKQKTAVGVPHHPAQTSRSDGTAARPAGSGLAAE